MYLPPLLRRKNAGYGVPSGTKPSPLRGVLGVDEGMMRLLVLTEGVAKGVLWAGVLSDEAAADRLLSLLRERLDDVGESGTCPDAMVSGSAVCATPSLVLGLRLRARSLLCNLERLLCGGGVGGGARKVEDGMVTGGRALVCTVACSMRRRQATRVDRLGHCRSRGCSSSWRMRPFAGRTCAILLQLGARKSGSGDCSDC